MRWSRAFLPVLKTNHADAQIVSHKLMLRAGLVRQTAAGIYPWRRLSYYTRMLAYRRAFQRVGIQAVPMKADPGPIGGALSHEFIVLAPTGEGEVFYDAACEEIDWQQSDVDYGDGRDLHRLFAQVS